MRFKLNDKTYFFSEKDIQELKENGWSLKKDEKGVKIEPSKEGNVSYNFLLKKGISFNAEGYITRCELNNPFFENFCDKYKFEDKLKEGQDWMKNTKTDSIVEAVREDLLQRSQKGIKKYGTTLADNPLELKQWLQHAYEECLDQANYLKSAILKLEKDGN